MIKQGRRLGRDCAIHAPDPQVAATGGGRWMMNETIFVLGGNDAEMETIKELLTLAGKRWFQPNKGWGEHKYSPSDLGLEPTTVKVATGAGYMYNNIYDRDALIIKGVRRVVFIECRPADGWPEIESDLRMVVIDHHGERSGEPASILQLLRFLPDLQLSEATRRWIELIAANDAGYIPAMVALGASTEEVGRVRVLDRSVQGITSEQEVEAERAINTAKTRGRLMVVSMAHSKCATITDRLYGRYDQLLVLADDGEANFFGDGALCATLKKKFGGWSGGSGLGNEGGSAYWGCSQCDKEVLTSFISENIE